MTTKGIITIVVMVLLANLTPAGLYVYVLPIIVGCMWGKKVWKFYFDYLFKDER